MGIWDIVHYVQSLRVQAHAGELVAAGLKTSDRTEALSTVWTSLSDAAQAGHLDHGVIQEELAQLDQHPLKVAQGPVPALSGGRP